MKMKASLMFRDQLSAINDWFEHWNECEQTVALYSLFKRLGSIQARFLGRVLEHSLMESQDFPLMEQQANSSVFVKSLCNEPREAAIGQLLQLLPLLSPGNEDAKAQYLSLIPLLLAHSLQTGSCMEECRQLLSYSLIHPALSSSDRNSLNLWLHHLGENMNMEGSLSPPPHLSHTHLLGNSTTSNGNGHSRLNGWKNGNMTEDVLGSSTTLGYGNSFYIQPPVTSSNNGGLCFHGRIRRSNSLTPPSVEAQPLFIEDVCPFRAKPRSMSLSSDHAPLSPQSSLASSGSSSESRLDETKNNFNIEGSGMKDVPSWLKSLRLHKYSYLFAPLSYEQMLYLTEDQLESQNVTKGARHKIILSIQKLKERQEDLRLLEKSVVEGVTSIRSALNELKLMLSTPIKSFIPATDKKDFSAVDDDKSTAPNSQSSFLTDNDATQVVTEGDLPGQLTRALGKVCTQVLVSSHLEDEVFQQFQVLIDKCIVHEAFNEVQKKKLLSWKQQVQRIWHPLPPRRGSDIRHNRGRWPSHYNGNDQRLVGGNNGYSSNELLGNLNRRRISGPFILQSSSNNNNNSQQSMVADHVAIDNHFVHHRNSVGMIQTLNQQPKRPTHLNVAVHPPISRAKSAPAKAIDVCQQLKNCCTDSPNDPEINNRLESLCLSVTEHALGGFS
ncbi:Protein Smaug 2 [Chamberlinius hualienensis]